MSDLHQAVQEEISAFTPHAVPPFQTITARKRARDRRRIAVSGAALGAIALVAAVTVPWATQSSPDRLPSYAGKQPAPGAVTYSLPPGEAWTACSELRPGDPVDDRSVICQPGEDVRIEQMDCSNGTTTYMRLERPGLDPLEAIVGQTPQWLKAGPIMEYGRSEFAFFNCAEH